jgi:hypothetical protein
MSPGARAEGWRWAEDVCGTVNPTRVAEFARHFYTDVDPRFEQLQKIPCPNLLLLGELDADRTDKRASEVR